ncbi:methylated-DNA--[protein]-cysteine S-methyltransferase [Kitasatospora aureofaciens]|uniref:methylated-DNA--[protein]-cysteine S-methyltransferase n=1 Tax=Kitasatospora aureofaciens TaxID=1894 RepID=UPI001D4EC1C8|nr:methylated-DNA--[protein]-cysteine S-methyltransferase [Kitasatospora aureofaciens]HJD82655.1 methylated-DNA--[protein]-cysteine S-methyltransferase [Kitasatospora aureofaciens]
MPQSWSLSWLTVPTPLPSGPMHIAVTPLGVAAAGYGGRDGETPPCTDPAKVTAVTERIGAYLAGRTRELGLPIDWSLSSGPHRTVLRTLRDQVPYGRTITYGELAARSGVFEDVTEPGLAARTVGQMMAANPVALLVPCHRVVAADGIGGFGGGRVGIDVKRWLLTLEGVLEPTLDWNGPL